MSRMVEIDGVWHEPPGYAALWGWFGLSRASWLTMPRVLMHAMPDDWQGKMAALLAEYDQTWDLPDCGVPAVTLRRRGKLTRMPEWACNYRHPDEAQIEALRSTPECSTLGREVEASTAAVN